MVTWRPSSSVSSTSLSSIPRRTPSETTSSTAFSTSSAVATGSPYIVRLELSHRMQPVRHGACPAVFTSSGDRETRPEQDPRDQRQQPRALQGGDQRGPPAAAQDGPRGRHGERRREQRDQRRRPRQPDEEDDGER